MRDRKISPYGIFNSEELSELQQGFDLTCQEIGPVLADGQFVREQIANIILSLGSMSTCLDASELKESALELYRAQVMQKETRGGFSS